MIRASPFTHPTSHTTLMEMTFVSPLFSRFDEFDEAIEEAIEEDVKEAEGGGRSSFLKQCGES